MTGNRNSAARVETVTEAGPEARWLTLVHGLSQHRGVFSAQVEAFRESHRLLLVDLPGHGLSASMPGPYGLEEYSAAVLAALDEAGVERTIYFGTHTGAGVGLLLACRAPLRFASLVLEGPVIPGRLPPVVVESLARISELGRTEGLAAARAFWWEQGWFDVMRERPGPCRAAGQRAMIEEFQCGPWLDTQTPATVAALDDQLAGLRLPVLIMNGEHDMSDFILSADELTALLPNARRAVIPGGGGFPLWEFPDQVNGEVRRFLDSSAG